MIRRFDGSLRLWYNGRHGKARDRHLHVQEPHRGRVHVHRQDRPALAAREPVDRPPVLHRAAEAVREVAHGVRPAGALRGAARAVRGLYIEPLWDWSKRWPVLRLDLGSVQPDRAEQLEGLFTNILDSEARRNGVPLRRGETAPVTFRNLLNDLAAASPDGQAVLLVDEYDKPLLGHLGRPTVEAFRTALKSFYSVIKATEAV